jgi:hypothetical protein
MLLAGHVVMAAAGVVLVVGALGSAIKATLIPRGVAVRVMRAVTVWLLVVYRLRAGRSATYHRRDRIMASFGPIALLLALAVWMSMVISGFALLYVALLAVSFARAFELSGSSVFTLGTTSFGHLGGDLLTYLQAGLGLLLLTLFITYFPSIYAAFSRRENGVALMRTRAGSPPRAANMLIRYHRISDAGRLPDLWQSWEQWFADVNETHATFAILPFFRSPEPDRSWITAAGTILDGASLWVSSVEHERDPDAQLCLRAGYLTLRHIAALYDVPFNPDPRPDDPISVTRPEWEAAMDEMAEAEMPVVADREVAWAAFQGWRVNYDAVLLNLARLLEAPPVPWVSDRSPVGERMTWTLREALRSLHPTFPITGAGRPGRSSPS